MFKTFGEKLKDIEIFYESKDYYNVVIETAKLMEQALGYLFKNFHRTLKTSKERLAFLNFEMQHDEKYSVFIKKPTIGVALGFYNSLLKYIPDHQWLHTDLKSAINKVNVVRNAQVHAGEMSVTDSEAGEVIDAAELFLKKTDIYDLPLEDIGFPLKYYLVYTSIQDKFQKGETESDFRKIIVDASKIIPELMNSTFNKVYSFLPIQYKEKLNQLHPKTPGVESKELSIRYFIEIFAEIKLFDQIEGGENLKTSLQYISEKKKESFTRRETRHHVTILEIIFGFLHNKKFDYFLDYANLVKKKYLEDSHITETTRIILADRAKEFGISETISKTIETTVIRTIETELILFQTLHEDKAVEKIDKFGRRAQKVIGGSERRIKKSYLYAMIGATFLIIVAAIYFIWIRSDFPAYERAFLKGQQEKFVEKSRKARILKKTRAHGLYIYGTWANNDGFMPEEIVSEYQNLLKRYPESPEAHFYLGEVYYFAYQNRYEHEFMDSAWILINKARDMGLKDFDVDNMRMQIIENLGIIPLVMESADELTKEYSKNPDTWNLIGNFYLTMLYDTLKAIENCQKGIEIYSDNLNAFIALSGIYTAQHKFDLALKMLERAVEINPDNGNIAYNYRYLFRESGRFNEAAGFFEDIIKRHNLKHVDFYRVLADLLIQQNDTTRAREFIETTLRKYPGDLYLEYYLNELKRYVRFEEEESYSTQNQNLTWFEDFEEAQALAMKEKKPILAEFFDHKNNYWFHKMNRDIYSDSSVQVMLTQFIPVRLYEITNPGIFKEYGIDYAYHDLKIISADGVKLEDIEVYIEHPEVALTALRKGLRKYDRYQLGKKLNTEFFTEVTNFEDAKLISKAKGFPIMMVVHNENSSHSKKLLNESLTDPGFKSEFNNLVYIMISAERHPDLLDYWDIRIFPSILFFDKEGDLIHRSYGYKTPKNLAEIVRKVKETYVRGEEFKPETNWLFSLEEAKTAALVEQKNIFMCSKSFRKDTTLMKDPEVINKLKDYICLSVEDVQNTDIISKYGYLYYYTCLILDPSGNELFKSYSLSEKERLLEWLDIEGKMKKMSLIGPDQYRIYRNQLDLASAMGNNMPLPAISIFKSQLEIFPDDLDIIRNLGDLCLYVKNVAEAIKYFQLEVEISSDYSDRLLDNMINAYLQLGKDRELKAWFDDQIQANAKNDSKQAKLYRFYSELSEILMDSVKAREYAFKAVKLNPNDYNSYSHLGRLLYYSGEYTQAKKYLTMATKNEKEATSAHLYLALIADVLGEHAEKQRNIEIAIEKSPDTYWTFHTFMKYYDYRSRFYQYPGYIALTIKDFNDVIRLLPNDFEMKSTYSLFLADFGEDLDLALKLINECIDKEPETWYYQDIKAWILFRMGKYVDADKTITLYMQNELDIFIDNRIHSLYHIGKIKLAIEDSIQGMVYLRKTQKFREINPTEEFIVEDVKSILDLKN